MLTKGDLADEAATAAVREAVESLAGPATEVLVVSEADPASVEAVRRLLAPGTTTVLIGRSGVGKSSLVNMLVGTEVLEVGAVREGDGKGRHTTVSREIVAVPGAGRIVDMPGVRGLGLWDAEATGGKTVFDSGKTGAPSSLGFEAPVELLPRTRYDSYQALCREAADVRDRREQARRLNKDKAAYSKHYRKKGAGPFRRGRRR